MKLAELTTLRVGGDAATVLAPETRGELVDAVLDVWASGEDWLLLGGGSNVLVGDDEFDGTVVRVVTRGIEAVQASSSTTVHLRVEAGESWDYLVETAVANGWAGIEGLSGIPGSCGAAPIQNIGAYGQELSDILVAIDFLDFLTGEVERIPAAELALGYRTSVLKQGRQGLVVSIELDLEVDDSGLSTPIRYAQLASALGVELGARVPLAEARETVLAVRGSKGMVLNQDDPDSVSAGSFFTNPIVTQSFARQLPADAPRWSLAPVAADTVVPLDGAAGAGAGAGADDSVPAIPAATPHAGEFLVKLSAAWLIENAGIKRGFALPGSRAAVSSKHTLALTNRGGATATEISELARYIQTRVLSEFGVRLHPEPVLVNVQF
jgi:UDP-N-acetylmuramate dehydrogenase